MPEVIEIRELGGKEPPREAAPVGGDPAADEGDGHASVAPHWRRRAAIGVVFVLFVTVAYLLTVGRPRSATPLGRASSAASPPVPVDATAAEEAARGAMDAWARFASTGDINQLGDRFDPAGPQFARLKAEGPGVAARTVGAAPYEFSTRLVGVSAGGRDDEELVSADVVVSRPGETDQAFTWELVLRRSGGRWRVWTVRDRVATTGRAG